MVVLRSIVGEKYKQCPGPQKVFRRTQTFLRSWSEFPNKTTKSHGPIFRTPFLTPFFGVFFEGAQKTPKKGGPKRGPKIRILVPFFGLSVGIPALKKWGGYPIFRSILRRVLGGPKRPLFWPFFGAPKHPQKRTKKGSFLDPPKPLLSIGSWTWTHFILKFVRTQNLRSKNFGSGSLLP